MNDNQDVKLPRVINIIDEYTIVLNVGKVNGVSKNDKFLVYCIKPEDLIDPETNENLGKLEVVRGSGVAIHVQDKLTTIKSDRIEEGGRIIRKPGFPFNSLLTGQTIEYPKESVPFYGVLIGDFAKPI